MALYVRSQISPHYVMMTHMNTHTLRLLFDNTATERQEKTDFCMSCDVCGFFPFIALLLQFYLVATSHLKQREGQGVTGNM